MDHDRCGELLDRSENIIAIYIINNINVNVAAVHTQNVTANMFDSGKTSLTMFACVRFYSRMMMLMDSLRKHKLKY